MIILIFIGGEMDNRDDFLSVFVEAVMIGSVNVHFFFGSERVTIKQYVGLNK